MPFLNPYRALIGRRDPVEVMAQTSQELPALVRRWPAVRFSDSYAPDKRSGHRILLHLLHVELVDGVRLRMALSTPGYAVQPFDPDAWMEAEPLANGPQALVTWSALRAVHLQLWRVVTPVQWALPFRHPECGSMTLGNLAEIWAGHDLHHLHQLRAIEEIARGRTALGTSTSARRAEEPAGPI